jgi:hypothetical protein
VIYDLIDCHASDSNEAGLDNYKAVDILLETPTLRRFGTVHLNASILGNHVNLMDKSQQCTLTHVYVIVYLGRFLFYWTHRL